MEGMFRFRQFAVRQDQCAMKVGTDGVLLGAWANGGNRILDIGTGTGLLALMMAQRFPLSVVKGIEIDARAAVQAQENVVASPFASRISIESVALQQFVPAHSFDSIVTNPPFYTKGFKVSGQARALARCAESLHFQSIFQFARNWLDDEGDLSAIVPFSVLDNFEAESCLFGFRLSRKTLLRTTPHKPISRCLVAFRKSIKGHAYIDTHCLLDTEGKRSEWYSDLCSSFYL